MITNIVPKSANRRGGKVAREKRGKGTTAEEKVENYDLGRNIKEKEEVLTVLTPGQSRT